MRTAGFLVAATSALGLASPAYAGDACPIGFVLIDLGVPAWASPELKASVADGDPFFDKLAAIAKKQPCTELVTKKLAGATALPLKIHDSVKIDLAMKTIEKSLYASNRGFRCKDAGKKLRALYEASYDGAPVLVVRGHRRILIVTAGWRSTCIDTDAAGAMKDSAIRDLWMQVTKPYVDDRHANP